MMFAVYASPQTHKELVEKIEKMEYEYNSTFKGTSRPTISEIKMYDVRIKKELVPLFMRDMNMMFTEDKVTSSKAEHTMFVGMKKSRDDTFTYGHRIITWIRKLTPFKSFKKATGTPDERLRLQGWAYVAFVGGLDDPHSPDGEEIL